MAKKTVAYHGYLLDLLGTAHSIGVEQPTRAILRQKHCGISMGTYWIWMGTAHGFGVEQPIWEEPYNMGKTLWHKVY